MQEDPNEFLSRQVHTAVNDKIGPHIIYYDDPSNMYCLYCGKKLTQSLKDGYSVSCDCDEYKRDMEEMKNVSNIDDKIKQYILKKENIIKELNKRENASGVKLAAKHYMSKKSERDEFDSKIAMMSN